MQNMPPEDDRPSKSLLSKTLDRVVVSASPSRASSRNNSADDLSSIRSIRSARFFHRSGVSSLRLKNIPNRFRLFTTYFVDEEKGEYEEYVRKLRKHFPELCNTDPESHIEFSCFPCSWSESDESRVPFNGKLFVTESHLAFYAKKLMSNAVKRVLDLKGVKTIKLKSRCSVALFVQKEDNQHEIELFFPLEHDCLSFYDMISQNLFHEKNTTPQKSNITQSWNENKTVIDPDSPSVLKTSPKPSLTSPNIFILDKAAYRISDGYKMDTLVTNNAPSSLEAGLSSVSSPIAESVTSNDSSSASELSTDIPARPRKSGKRKVSVDHKILSNNISNKGAERLHVSQSRLGLITAPAAKSGNMGSMTSVDSDRYPKAEYLNQNKEKGSFIPLTVHLILLLISAALAAGAYLWMVALESRTASLSTGKSHASHPDLLTLLRDQLQEALDQDVHLLKTLKEGIQKFMEKNGIGEN